MPNAATTSDMTAPTPSIPLAVEDVRRGLTTRAVGRALHLFEAIDSTNATAFSMARAGTAAHGTVILAESQTAGAGRLGRPWHSPPRLNIYCSVILDMAVPSTRASWIPLVTGLALADAIRQSTGIELSLKWPNDLLCHGKKIGGIVCESASHGSRVAVCVVGFGVNVNARAEDFPPALRPLATSLHRETQRVYDRNTLLAAALNHLERRYDDMTSASYEQMRRAYAQSCGTLGRDVLVTRLDGPPIQGTAVDIGSDGALLVSVKQEGRSHTVAVHSADVHHLR